MALFGGQGQLDTPEDFSIYSSPNLPSTFVDSQAVFNNSNYKPLQVTSYSLNMPVNTDQS